MIRHLVYVACDDCGDPIGGADDMADDAREARSRVAKDFVRVRRGGKLVDLCRRRCASEVSANRPDSAR